MIARVTIPERLKSRGNGRVHQMARARAAKKHVSLGGFIAAKLHAEMRQVSLVAERRRILFVRIAPRKLDTDNNVDAFKSIRDGIARWFEVDDGDEERWQWEYAQEKGPYAIRVEYEVMS